MEVFVVTFWEYHEEQHPKEWICSSMEVATKVLREETGDEKAKFNQFGEFYPKNGDEWFVSKVEVID